MNLLCLPLKCWPRGEATISGIERMGKTWVHSSPVGNSTLMSSQVYRGWPHFICWKYLCADCGVLYTGPLLGICLCQLPSTKSAVSMGLVSSGLLPNPPETICTELMLHPGHDHIFDEMCQVHFTFPVLVSLWGCKPDRGGFEGGSVHSLQQLEDHLIKSRFSCMCVHTYACVHVCAA